MTSSFIPLLPNASFGGIPFPYEDYSVKGSLRHHVHEYPNRPGGDVEPLGRKLYEIAFTCAWHVNLVGWPGLIPGTLRAIRQLCETGSTYPLVVPDIGTIQAKAIEWPYSLSVKALSGTKITLKFLEQSQQTALVQPVQSVSLDSLQPAAEALLVIAEADTSLDMNLLDNIIDAVTAVVALIGIAEVGDILVQRRVSAVMSACQAFCDLPDCRPPRRYLLVQSVRDLWQIAMLILLDALRRATPILQYMTPRMMTIVDVSIVLYGQAGRALELLKLNELDSALRIPPQTSLRYYAPTRVALS
jgi:DNA circularisation protein N-terminus